MNFDIIWKITMGPVRLVNFFSTFSRTLFDEVQSLLFRHFNESFSISTKLFTQRDFFDCVTFLITILNILYLLSNNIFLCCTSAYESRIKDS